MRRRTFAASWAGFLAGCLGGEGAGEDDVLNGDPATSAETCDTDENSFPDFSGHVSVPTVVQTRAQMELEVTIENSGDTGTLDDRVSIEPAGSGFDRMEVPICVEAPAGESVSTSDQVSVDLEPGWYSAKIDEITDSAPLLVYEESRPTSEEVPRDGFELGVEDIVLADELVVEHPFLGEKRLSPDELDLYLAVTYRMKNIGNTTTAITGYPSRVYWPGGYDSQLLVRASYDEVDQVPSAFDDDLELAPGDTTNVYDVFKVIDANRYWLEMTPHVWVIDREEAGRVDVLG